MKLKTTLSGVSVCTFRIACTRNFKNASGEYDADFFTCTAWRNTAEYVARNFMKGQIVVINGEIHINTVNKDGTKTTYVEVTAEKVFPGGPKTTQPSAQQNSNTYSPSDTEYDYSGLDIDDPDLPFNN